MQQFNLLLTSLPDGILLGFVYGVAAMGLTLIWGVMNVINLSHGPIIALGMFGTFILFINMGINPYVGLFLIAALGLLLGILIYFIAVHRVIDAPHLSSLLATFAVNMIIIGIGTAVFTTSPYNVDFNMGSFKLGNSTVLGTRLIAALISILFTGGLYLFLYRTRPGKFIRAVANNRAAAELMGVPSTRILALSFGLGTMLAAVSGALIATFFPFSILSGGGYELKSFVIGVLGGLGNPIGALLGGLILGVLEGIIPAFLNTSWVPVIEFGLFVVILLVRPNWPLWSEKMKNWRNHLGLLLPLLAVAALAAWPLVTDNISNRENAFTILKAIALASSLNILLGYTGYVSFGHIVFYGFGGYVGLYFVNEQGWSIWTGMLVGGISSGSACIPAW